MTNYLSMSSSVVAPSDNMLHKLSNWSIQSPAVLVIQETDSKDYSTQWQDKFTMLSCMNTTR